MAVYKREEIPAHFHYRHNGRIMPILLEAKEGWTIMQNRTGQFMRTYRKEPSVFRLFLRGSEQQLLPSLFIASQPSPPHVELTELDPVHVMPAVINKESQIYFPMETAGVLVCGFCRFVVQRLPKGASFFLTYCVSNGARYF